MPRSWVGSNRLMTALGKAEAWLSKKVQSLAYNPEFHQEKSRVGDNAPMELSRHSLLRKAYRSEVMAHESMLER